MEKRDAPVSFRQVIKNRQFRALWLAQLVSNFGDWLALLALFSFIAFRLHGTPSQIGWMLISFTLPVAILGPIAGVFVDRWNLKRTMIASDLIRAILAALLAVSTELYQIYLLAFALSCVSCFFLPAQTVVIPLLVRKEELLDSLSIVGVKVALRGTASINGNAGYKFLLTAMPALLSGGSVDLFRIKVWNTLTGIVVYDTQMGAPDNADPTTALGAGSKIIYRR